MAKSRKSKPSKPKKKEPQKVRVMIERKREFADVWEEAIITRAWDLECARMPFLRGLYGEDIARRERQELEE